MCHARKRGIQCPRRRSALLACDGINVTRLAIASGSAWCLVPARSSPPSPEPRPIIIVYHHWLIKSMPAGSISWARQAPSRGGARTRLDRVSRHNPTCVVHLSRAHRIPTFPGSFRPLACRDTTVRLKPRYFFARPVNTTVMSNAPWWCEGE